MATQKRFKVEHADFLPQANESGKLRPFVPIPMGVVVLGALARGLFVALRQPWSWVLVAVTGAMTFELGWAGVVIMAVATVLYLLMWSRLHPASFDRLVRLPTRGAFRRLMVYRRDWQPVMEACGLNARVVDRQYLPTLRGVRSTASVDRVRVRMLPGQVLDDWSRKSGRLALSFGAAACRVRSAGESGEIELWFLVDGLLSDVVSVSEALGPNEPLGVDLAA